jgi:hypothetical protein
MAQNQHILQRLAGIQGQLIAGYKASASMSSAAKGFERQEFIDKFLAQVLPTPFRFATGDATDKDGHKSGQLDVVIEFPFGPSLPIVGAATSRLFLAETVAAVIEVKSNVAAQWGEAVATAKQLHPLVRSYRTAMIMGSDLPKIPLFVAGFEGWQQLSTVENHLASAPEISGVLVIEPGIFVSSPHFGEITATGPWALWGLIACLHQSTGFLKAVSTNLLEYTI